VPLELLMGCDAAVQNSQISREAARVGVCGIHNMPKANSTFENYLQPAGRDTRALAGLHACARS
jgi:hypothetical protein